MSVCDKAGNCGKKSSVDKNSVGVLSTFKHRFTGKCWMQILPIVMLYCDCWCSPYLPYSSFHIFFHFFTYLTSHQHHHLYLYSSFVFFFFPFKKFSHLIWIMVLFFHSVFFSLPLLFKNYIDKKTAVKKYNFMKMFEKIRKKLKTKRDGTYLKRSVCNSWHLRKMKRSWINKRNADERKKMCARSRT